MTTSVVTYTTITISLLKHFTWPLYTPVNTFLNFNLFYLKLSHDTFDSITVFKWRDRFSQMLRRLSARCFVLLAPAFTVVFPSHCSYSAVFGNRQLFSGIKQVYAACQTADDEVCKHAGEYKCNMQQLKRQIFPSGICGMLNGSIENWIMEYSVNNCAFLWW